MKENKTETNNLKKWLHDHKELIVDVAIGASFFGIGLAYGYKKWGLITTIRDPFSNAFILTKRHLSEKECNDLAGIVMNNGYNTAAGLNTMNLLY